MAARPSHPAREEGEVAKPAAKPLGPRAERDDESDAVPPREPSFFDVRALARRASSPDPQEAQHKVTRRREVVFDNRAEEPIVPLELSGPRRLGKATSATDARPAWQRQAATGGVVLLLVLLGFFVGGPMLVRSRVASAARAAGLEATVDGVHFGFDALTLSGLTLKTKTGWLVVRVETTELRGWSHDKVRLENVDVELETTAASLGPLLADLIAGGAHELCPIGSSADPPRTVTASDARVTWRGALGEGTEIVGTGGSFDMELRPRAASAPRPRPGASTLAPKTYEGRATLTRVEVKRGDITLGPWAAAFELTPASSRARIAFDPPVPDGPSAIFLWGVESSAGVKIKIPRTPIAQLGLVPAVGGPWLDDKSELEVQLDGTQVAGTDRVETRYRFGIFGAHAAGKRAPLDLVVEGSATGNLERGLEMTATTARMGPFYASLQGTVAAHATGLKLDVSFRVQPVPCDRLLRGGLTLGPFSAYLQELGRAAGIRATGFAQATGLLTLDTAAPEETKLRATTSDSCGLELFDW